jgi:hypothetical protein
MAVALTLLSGVAWESIYETHGLAAGDLSVQT